jgi:hypothetical protein
MCMVLITKQQKMINTVLETYKFQDPRSYVLAPDYYLGVAGSKIKHILNG